MITRTGYIGLGNIGREIALNVLRGGFDLMVYDLRQEPLDEFAALGAKIAHSPKEVGAHAELVELSVVDDAQVEAAILGEGGVLEGAHPGLIVAVHSTMHPDTVRRVAAKAKEHGVEVIDAAPSRTSEAAPPRFLSYMIGGDPDLVERCRPVFETSAAHIFNVGGVGTGVTAKLAQQVITTVTLLGVSEGRRMAAAAGMDLEVFRQVVAVSSAQSHMADRHLTDVPVKKANPERDGWYQGIIPAARLAHDLGVSVPAAALFQQRIPEVFGWD
ncbi:MAG: 2-hydroxy-3-oxopropionate reductase [Chloroflexi bacterium]|nr:2-hydroxy-3-oxopropionate reductase [Chloroflexota bacterium]